MEQESENCKHFFDFLLRFRAIDKKTGFCARLLSKYKLVGHEN